MQYMNGHAPQIGDIIEVPSTGQRLVVTAIPQAGIIRCGQSNLRVQGCALLERVGGMSVGYTQQGYGLRQDNGLGVGYAGGYMDPGLALVEDLLIMDATLDIVEDIAIMDDFGGGFF